MPVQVKTLRTSGEAAATLSSERDAPVISAVGTLVMRALNEGESRFDDRAGEDRALTLSDLTGSRVRLRRRSFARVLAEAELRLCIRRTLDRGPACQTWYGRRVTCSAPTPPSAMSPVPCSRWIATVPAGRRWRARRANRGVPGRTRSTAGGLRAFGLVPGPVRSGRFRLLQDCTNHAEGRLRGNARAHVARGAAARRCCASSSARWRHTKVSQPKAASGRLKDALDARDIAAAVAAVTEGTSPVDVRSPAPVSARGRRACVCVLLTGQHKGKRESPMARQRAIS